MKYWDKAWSLVEGCSPVSAACDHCWLAGWAHRFGPSSGGIDFTDDKGRFDGTVRIREDRLDIPLRTRKPTVFAVWSDLFHEKVPDEFIYQALATAKAAEKHTFLILTKRPERMARIADLVVVNDGIQSGDIHWFSSHLANVWFGTTVENQQAANGRIPHLLGVPGKRFLSIEPLLGPVDLRAVMVQTPFGKTPWDVLRGGDQIHAVIVGGESGPKARPMHPDWVRSLRDQCAGAGVPFTCKQMGTVWDREHGKNNFPDDLKIVQLPWDVSGMFHVEHEKCEHPNTIRDLGNGKKAYDIHSAANCPFCHGTGYITQEEELP